MMLHSVTIANKLHVVHSLMLWVHCPTDSAFGCMWTDTHVYTLFWASIFSLPLGLSGRRGIAVACVCPSVHPSVRKLYLVRTITRHRFVLESPNLHQTCILGYSRLVLKMEVIDLDLHGHFGHFDSEFLEIWLVRTITRHRLVLESPNLH